MKESASSSQDGSPTLRWAFIGAITQIDDDNRDNVIQWLDDRSQFHSWFTSVVTGSLVVSTFFGREPLSGEHPNFAIMGSLAAILLSVICNLLCVWAIPTWKLGVATKAITNGKRMHLDLAATAWIGMVLFLCGLALAIYGQLIDIPLNTVG